MKSMQGYANIAKIVVVFLTVIIVVGCLFFNYMSSAVGNSDEKKVFSVNRGETYSQIAVRLKSDGFIHSEKFFRMYVKLVGANSLQAGDYYLSNNMNIKQVIEVLEGGTTNNSDTIRITFNENINMRAVASIIEKNTNNSSDDVFKLLKDEDYLKKLIEEYDFISDDILNDDLYYSLEGYLEPNTYEFMNKDVTVEEIFKVLLDHRKKTMDKYEKEISASKLSVHEIITLASIVESESSTDSEMPSIASVFYNRLAIGMALGSDVTTYYAEGIDMGDRDLYDAELKDCNAYNTRSDCLAGKLPVGPISNPSSSAIEAVLNPKENDYYYFVADKNGKVYYNTDYAGHVKTIRELKSAGLWYEY